MSDSTTKFPKEQDEPIFIAIPSSDPAFQDAYAIASRTVPKFIAHLQSGISACYAAKLRFRDPDASERLGADQFLFLWLTGVRFLPAEHLFSGTFFEVPRELQKYHQVGQELAFEGEDIFDWMVLTADRRLFGGFTLRVTRSKLPENDRANYDRYIGVSVYEPEPG
jgi:uncharacterized protein YegJ (DUF2314 family)